MVQLVWPEQGLGSNPKKAEQVANFIAKDVMRQHHARHFAGCLRIALRRRLAKGVADYSLN